MNAGSIQAIDEASPVEHRERQQRYYDSEIVDQEFEISRPRDAGRFYTFLMEFKVGTALRLTQRDLTGSRVLVVCAGSGMDAELLLQLGLRVTCLDISTGALTRAAERAHLHGLAYGLVAGDAEQLPFADASFDYSFVHDGLHHLGDPNCAIAEMARVSRHGVLITEPADALLSSIAIRLGLMSPHEEAGNLVYRLHQARLRPLFERLGLPAVRHRRYVMKYRHKPGRLARLLDLPLIYPLARAAFLLFGVRLFGALGNKLALVALRSDPVGQCEGSSQLAIGG